MESQLKCKYCSALVSESDFFCPNCGKEIKAKPLDTGILKQVGVYLLSALLPPFGLFPAIKYLRQQDLKSKKIGIAAIVITIIATVLSLWAFYEVMNSVSKQINSGFDIINY